MRISQERKRRGWSQAELARRASLNSGTVSLIESGRLQPYPSQLRKLASALGMPEREADRLLDEDGDMDAKASAQQALASEGWHQQRGPK